MSYINNKMVCIRKNTEANHFELVANNIVMDTSDLYEYYGDGWYNIEKLDDTVLYSGEDLTGRK